MTVTKCNSECREAVNNATNTARALSDKFKTMIIEGAKILKENQPLEKVYEYIEMLKPIVEKYQELNADFLSVCRGMGSGLRRIEQTTQDMKGVMNYTHKDSSKSCFDYNIYIDYFIRAIECSRDFKPALAKVYNRIHSDHTDLPSLEEFIKQQPQVEVENKIETLKKVLTIQEQLEQLRNENQALRKELEAMTKKNIQTQNDKQELENEILALKEELESFKLKAEQHKAIKQEAESTAFLNDVSQEYKNEDGAALSGDAANETHLNQ